MGHRPSCRSCRHCVSSPGATAGWCHLRRLAIHTEYSSDLWCHHWTARPPRLPLGEPGDLLTAAQPQGCRVRRGDGGSGDAPLSSCSQQLSLEALLPEF